MNTVLSSKARVAIAGGGLLAIILVGLLVVINLSNRPTLIDFSERPDVSEMLMMDDLDNYSTEEIEEATGFMVTTSEAVLSDVVDNVDLVGNDWCRIFPIEEIDFQERLLESVSDEFNVSRANAIGRVKAIYQQCNN